LNFARSGNDHRVTRYPSATVLLTAPVLAFVLVGCAHDSTSTSATSTATPTSAPSNTAAPPEQPLGAFTVTCHTGAGQTASGRPDGPGLAAVDTDVFPLGTKLRVEKVGTVTAADRGGAVDGRSLDVWVASTADCTAFGRQHLQVWRSAS
jgi:3D (Asp-Asp-Asp) domain-containing protein